ncbi:sortase [uncultured Thermanaerothrix sp.]|uniref:sortase n=1 Tax=uncultured Thermanaerothrix sp. TaxID=1195149 RepID=UPI00260DEC48|nr:sortase [uncultured Thermanaerothrix sp.]
MKMRSSWDWWRLGGVLLLFGGLVGLGVSLYQWQAAQTFESGVVINETSSDIGFVPLTLSEAQEGPPTLVAPPPQELTTLSGTPGMPSSSLPTEAKPTPSLVPAIPQRLIISKIDLDAPVVPVKTRKIQLGEGVFEQWLAPDEFAAGWPTATAMLGQAGNTVLIGHHNVHGKVFERLHELEPGDLIVVEGGGRRFSYVVVNVMILPERDADLKTRLENARWIQRSQDERLTLVTCWPAYSNTHRLVVVARSLGQAPLPSAEPE